MKEIAVVICNYNKKDYILNCIESLKKQKYNSFDIYVVDNASTDGSVEVLEKKNGTEIILLKNNRNLGGSGGFNTGLKEVLKYNYKYIILLDNDVVLDELCVEKLYETMEVNEDIGIQGCKIMKMDYPDIIQEFGPIVNYETLTFELCFGGEKEDAVCSKIRDCDYVPACAVIIRKSVINKIGLLPEENFIYYDDIEWGIKCNRAGFRVVANADAKAWHKGGAAINPTTFSNYYLLRNKIRFFMKYIKTKEDIISEEEIVDRANKILNEVFEGIYSCNYNGYFNVVKTRMEAFLDALNGKTGKAEVFKIRKKEKIVDRLEEILVNKKSILIHMNNCFENTRRILFRIQELERKNNQHINITLLNEDVDLQQMKILGFNVLKEMPKSKVKYDLEVHICSHIYELEITKFDRIWIDGWGNVISNKKDFLSQQDYKKAFSLFKLCFEDKLIDVIRKEL